MELLFLISVIFGNHHTFPFISLNYKRINISSTVGSDYYTYGLFMTGNKTKLTFILLVFFPVNQSWMINQLWAAFMYLNQVQLF